MTSTTVTSIDFKKKEIMLAGEPPVQYGKLLLTTGSTVCHLYLALQLGAEATHHVTLYISLNMSHPDSHKFIVRNTKCRCSIPSLSRVPSMLDKFASRGFYHAALTCLLIIGPAVTASLAHMSPQMRCMNPNGWQLSLVVKSCGGFAQMLTRRKENTLRLLL